MSGRGCGVWQAGGRQLSDYARNTLFSELGPLLTPPVRRHYCEREAFRFSRI